MSAVSEGTHSRFRIRWDDGMGCYRVNVPKLDMDGEGVEVVSAAEYDRARVALDELREELAAFAEYSRSVAADAVGQARLTWQERAEWADRLAERARA